MCQNLAEHQIFKKCEICLSSQAWSVAAATIYAVNFLNFDVVQLRIDWKTLLKWHKRDIFREVKILTNSRNAQWSKFLLNFVNPKKRAKTVNVCIMTSWFVYFCFEKLCLLRSHYCPLCNRQSCSSKHFLLNQSQFWSILDFSIIFFSRVFGGSLW